MFMKGQRSKSQGSSGEL